MSNLSQRIAALESDPNAQRTQRIARAIAANRLDDLSDVDLMYYIRESLFAAANDDAGGLRALGVSDDDIAAFVRGDWDAVSDDALDKIAKIATPRDTSPSQ